MSISRSWSYCVLPRCLLIRQAKFTSSFFVILVPYLEGDYLCFSYCNRNLQWVTSDNMFLFLILCSFHFIGKYQHLWVCSKKICPPAKSLWWRHNDHDSVSNHQPHECLLNRLFRRRSKKTSKLRVTGLCVGNSPGPVNSPHKGPVTRKMFPFDDVIMCPSLLGAKRLCTWSVLLPYLTADCSICFKID